MLHRRHAVFQMKQSDAFNSDAIAATHFVGQYCRSTVSRPRAQRFVRARTADASLGRRRRSAEIFVSGML